MGKGSLPIIYIVLPCYNEEEVLGYSIQSLVKKIEALIRFKRINKLSRLVFVDDGSKDGTWRIIVSAINSRQDIVGLKLSKNRGHQNALLAGLIYSKDKADAVISMDVDLQDDINVIDSFIDKFQKGFEVVYGVRSSRKTDTLFKRGTARIFYRIMQFMGGDVICDHADFRLMSRRALSYLDEYKEVNLFLRGIVPTIGLPSTTINYARSERLAGKSKYSLRKMISFAFDGITSFSVKPIRLILILGLFMSMVSFIFLIYIIVRNSIGATVQGWSFIACSVWLLGGVQMMSIGFIGEYIGKIYSEVKARPRYFIEEVIEPVKSKKNSASK